MQADLIARLRGDTTLAGLLGEKGGRPAIDWVARPDRSSVPAVTLTDISQDPDYTQDGRGAWTEATVQMDVWSETVLGGVNVTNRLLAIMEPKATVGGTVFNRAFCDAGARNMRVEDLAGGQRLNHRSMDFRFQYKNAN